MADKGAPVGRPEEAESPNGLLDRSFRGSFTHVLDEKGRVSIPAPFRQALSERKEDALVLTNFICDGARCIEGFSRQTFEVFERRLSRRSRFDPKIRKLENYYLARAAICPIDSSGRISIPQYLRTYAGLEKDVVFTSTLSGFRIWDERVWEMIFSDAEAALLEDPALFEDVDAL